MIRPAFLGSTIGGYFGSSTKVMLHCNGTDGSTTIEDSSSAPKTFTARGGAALDTAQKRFGTASLLLDGVDDYIDTPDHDDFALGSDPLTIDLQVRFNAVPADTTAAIADAAGIFGQRADATHLTLFMIYAFESGGKTYHAFNLYCIDGAGTGVSWLDHAYRVGGAYAAFVAGQWYHIAIIKGWGGVATSLAVTVEGALAISAPETIAGAYPNIAAAFEIGRCVNVDGEGKYTNGRLDEIRWTKGEALWTAEFVPPAGEYRAAA